MLVYLLNFILGLAASEWFSHLLFYSIFIVNLIALSILGIFGGTGTRYFLRFLLCTAFFIAGFFYPLFYEKFTNPWDLPTSLIKKSVLVEGYIDSIPKQAKRFSQFEFSTTIFNGKPLHTKLKLSWYNNTQVFRAGEKCVLPLRLKPAHGLKNPGIFDYEKYLKSNNIRATGYVIERENPRCVNDPPWNYYLLKTRQSIQETISKGINIDNIAGLIAALTVGSRTEMTSNQWKTLQNTGTSHLMAISGLHVAFIASLIYFIVNFVWRLFPFAMRRFPAQKSAALVSMFCAIIYGFLAGFSLPTQRAVIMIVVLIGFEFFNKSTNVAQRLLWAAAIILLFQPLAISQASFWLSFAAVAWICFGVIGYQKLAKWRLWMRVQWVCFLGLLPITLQYFHQISVVTFLANGLAIPWVGIIIVPLCFIASILFFFHLKIAEGLFWIIAYLFWPLWKILVYLGNLHFAVWHQSVLNPMIFFSCMIAVVLFLAPKRWPGKWLGGIFALPLFFYSHEKPAMGDVWLTVLDVGQGLASVVQTEHHTLIYDAGPKTYGGFDSGESIVVPFLRRIGVSHLDMMIISHGDNDHRGGAPAILSAFPTDSLLSSEPQKLADFAAKNCFDGQSWTWDGVDFSIINPPKNEAYLRNNSSCVLQVRAHGQAILLPGDIEKEGEALLLTHYPKVLESIVMLAPHHGSKTSSTQAFLAAVRPKYIIAATGFYNQFHFPSPQVLARYATFHAKLLDTATEGAIQVRVMPLGKVTVKALTGRG